jgi:beta-lactamase regulating signal transducer with metallopeptidase domain
MNALMNPFITASAKGAAWLLVWSWQTAILLGCVWAGLKIFRVKSPALRHQVWLFALIAVAAMPVLGGAVRGLRLPQPNNRALNYAVELPRTVVTNEAATVVQNPSPVARVEPSTRKPIILSLSFALWIAGVCAVVMKAAINSVRLRRLRVGARRASLADLDCDECDCEALRNGRVGLALSNEIRSPLLFGVLRPMIVFPADIASWTSPMERWAMLKHELAHVERRDHYVNLFQTVLGAVFFFHPLARYACRQLSVEREMACDDHVVCSGVEAGAYAEVIVKVAERSIAPIGAPGGAHQLALFSARQILERRIEMILNKDRGRVIARKWKYLILSAALIAIVAWTLLPARSTSRGLAQVDGRSAPPTPIEEMTVVAGRELKPIVGNDKGPVFDLLRTMFDAALRRDTSVLERVLDDNFIRTDPNGRVRNKAQCIAEDLNPNFNPAKKFEFADISVRGTPDLAIATFQGTAYMEATGQGDSAQFRYTVGCVKRGVEWKVLTFHASVKQADSGEIKGEIKKVGQ